MSLLAYNLTTAPLVLTGVVPVTTLPASVSAGVRGPAFNVTGELKTLTAPAFALLQVQVAAGQVEYEWTAQPEFNTFTLVVGSAQRDLDDIPVALYVNPSTGNDTNPGSLGLPFATFQRAMQALPVGTHSTVDIFLAAGQFPLTGPNSGIDFFPGTKVGGTSRQLNIHGTPVDQLGPLTTIAGSTAKRIKATVTTVNGALRGAFIVNTVSGAQSMIVDNTFAAGDTTFVLDGPVGLAAAGRPFTVKRPGSEILITNSAPNFRDGVFVFHDTKLTTDVTAFSHAIVINTGATLKGIASEMHIQGMFQLVVTPLGGILLADELAGWYIHGDNVCAIGGTAAQYIGNFILDGCVFTPSNGSMVSLNSLFMNVTDTFVTDSTFEVLFGKITGGGSFGFGQLVFRNSQAILGADDTGSSVGPNALEISNSAPGVPGVFVSGGSVICGGVSGTVNATYGLQAANFAGIQTTAGDTTVTGTINDVLVGGTASNYAGLPITDAVTLSRIFV